MRDRYASWPDDLLADTWEQRQQERADRFDYLDDLEPAPADTVQDESDRAYTRARAARGAK